MVSRDRRIPYREKEFKTKRRNRSAKQIKSSSNDSHLMGSVLFSSLSRWTNTVRCICSALFSMSLDLDLDSSLKRTELCERGQNLHVPSTFYNIDLLLKHESAKKYSLVRQATMHTSNEQ